jgi:hypothetical protein
MMSITRVKKTKKIVYPLGAADSMHTLVLFPFEPEGHVSKKGFRADIRRMRNENLVSTKEIL